MRFFSVLILLGLRLLLHANEYNQRGNFHFIKLLNGFDCVLSTQNTPSVQISLFIRCGSLTETDTNRGVAYILQNIAAAKISSGLSRNSHGISHQQVQFNAFTTPEHTVYQFNTSAAHIQPLLKLITDSLFYMKFTTAEFNAAKESIVQEQKIAIGNYQKRLMKLIHSDLFRLDSLRFDITGGDKIVNTSRVSADSFFVRYYTPQSAVLAVCGNIRSRALSDMLQNTIAKIPVPEFNQEIIIRLYSLRSMIYSTRHTVFADVSRPELHFYWQLPGLNNNLRVGHIGYLLESILNDQNNYLHAKLRKMDCRRFETEIDGNNYYSILKITVEPSAERFEETYYWLVNELKNISNTLMNETMLNVGKIRFKQAYDYLMHGPGAELLIAKYWRYSNEDYFLNLGDSISSTDLVSLRKFTKDYICESPHLTITVISDTTWRRLGLDTLLPDVDESINETVFTYRPNITDLEGPDNLQKLRRLLHWVKLNPDIQIQINGFSDEGEYNKSYDDSVVNFIDSITTFRKTNPDKIRKRFLRPEMMRAMKIIKFLYDNGIDKERLSGTSMSLSSSNKREALENMKCTTSLNLYRKTISLYEYHYGKPKPKQ
ncbi:MAG: insulinase family protein [Chitinophagales bacterium]|nr:insulinase family protein [Chitinophagales bacterium]MDW8419339.1 insulinase family protein [Chitinophagales bacterium]